MGNTLAKLPRSNILWHQGTMTRRDYSCAPPPPTQPTSGKSGRRRVWAEMRRARKATTTTLLTVWWAERQDPVDIEPAPASHRPPVAVPATNCAATRSDYPPVHVWSQMPSSPRRGSCSSREASVPHWRSGEFWHGRVGVVRWPIQTWCRIRSSSHMADASRGNSLTHAWPRRHHRG